MGTDVFPCHVHYFHAAVVLVMDANEQWESECVFDMRVVCYLLP